MRGEDITQQFGVTNKQYSFLKQLGLQSCFVLCTCMSVSISPDIPANFIFVSTSQFQIYL